MYTQRNLRLCELYCKNWNQLKTVMGRFHDLSSPYLFSTHPDYEEAKIRLVVVGQETAGWELRDCLGRDTEMAVDRLMDKYRDFELGTHHRGNFWQFPRQFYDLLNPKGKKLGFMALNASKFSQNKKDS